MSLILETKSLFISVAHQPDIPLQPVATLSRADIIIAVIMTIIVHGVAPETILPARRPSQSEVLRFSSSFTPAETVSGLGFRVEDSQVKMLIDVLRGVCRSSQLVLGSHGDSSNSYRY